MFRVITAFVEKPSFLLVCDSRNCGGQGHAEIPAEALKDMKSMSAAQQEFLSAATKDGWSIGLDAQMCPGHTQMAREQMEARLKENERRVIVPGSGVVNPASKAGLAIVRS